MMYGLGIAPANTAETREMTVSPGWTEPWLDAALRVSNIPSGQAGRVPQAVRSILEGANSEVDQVAWGGGSGLEDYGGRVYVRWKPSRAENAITYADIARRMFAAAAEGFPAGSRIIMERYRIDRMWPWEDIYVYPEGGQIPASAPEVAHRTVVDDIVPSADPGAIERGMSAGAGLSRNAKIGIVAGASGAVVLGFAFMAWRESR